MCYLLICLQVCIYCTLLPLRASGAQLPKAVSAFMEQVAGQPAVKAGTEQVSCAGWLCTGSITVFRVAEKAIASHAAQPTWAHQVVAYHGRAQQKTYEGMEAFSCSSQSAVIIYCDTHMLPVPYPC